MPTLLWITEWGIWPSSENLEHETEDLASFMQIAMLNGWGGYVLTDANYVNNVRKELATGPPATG